MAEVMGWNVAQLNSISTLALGLAIALASYNDLSAALICWGGLTPGHSHACLRKVAAG